MQNWFEEKMKDDMLPYVLAEKDKWREWAFKIPFIEFPAGWKVSVSPPFGGAVARFRVRLPEMSENDSISIYLDCYDRLGCYGQPYWEVYPYKSDCGRCDMSDTAELLRMIADRSSNE